MGKEHFEDQKGSAQTATVNVSQVELENLLETFNLSKEAYKRRELEFENNAIRMRAELDKIVKQKATLMNQLLVSQKQLQSVRYKIGDYLALAVTKPGMNTVLLPFRLSALGKNWFLKIYNKIMNTFFGVQATEGYSSLDNNQVDLQINDPDATLNSDTYLFVPVNGAGLGHLSRCLAVAKRLKEQKPVCEILFLTTSVALSVIHRLGFVGYHVPSKKTLGSNVDETRWNDLLAKAILDVCSSHSPGTIIFDGGIPYDGLIKSFQALKKTNKVWIKRGLYKDGEAQHRWRESSDYFDKIIVPSELLEGSKKIDEKSSEDKIVTVPPIIYGAEKELFSKEESRTRLGVSLDKKVVYVQLGAGNINDTSCLLTQVITALNEIPEVEIVLGESIISHSDTNTIGKYVLLKNYPNHVYYNGFDLAILAAGYNSVYESLFFNLPTVFFPNFQTGIDDQKARAELATRCGDNKIMESFSKKIFIQNVQELLSKQSGECADFENGASHAARAVIEL